GSISPASVHLGRAVFVDSRSGALAAGRARNRHLSVGALAARSENPADVSDGTARGDSLDRLRPLGDFRPRPRRAEAGDTDTGLAQEGPVVLGPAAGSRNARGGLDPRGH